MLVSTLNEVSSNLEHESEHGNTNGFAAGGIGGAEVIEGGAGAGFGSA